MRRFAASHPLAASALAGATTGLAAAVLLLIVAGTPGTAAYAWAAHTSHAVSLPVGPQIYSLFDRVWPGSRASEFLVILPLNGAAWGLGIAILARRLHRSVRARRIAASSAMAGTALAVLVGMIGFPETEPWDGPGGLILLAQLPGAALLTMAGYDTYWWDGSTVDGRFHPGRVTILLFSLANTLVIAGAARVAGFTWRWIRMPLPPRGRVAES
jgi:hypothetical protein